MALLSTMTLLVHVVQVYNGSSVIVLVLLAAFGYILSIDLSGFGCRILDICFHKASSSPSGFLWRIGIREIIFHSIVCVGVCSLSVVSVLNYSYLQSSVYLCYGIIGVFTLNSILCSCQQVYVFFGLFRNPLYPLDANIATKFKSRKKLLYGIGILRRIIFNGGEIPHSNSPILCSDGITLFTDTVKPLYSGLQGSVRKSPL